MSEEVLVVLLNGPLGIGKSTLAEVLGESLEQCVTLDGDSLLALNPPPKDEIASLHAAIALLVAHHFTKGYRRFIINHFWSRSEDFADLRARLEAQALRPRLRCYRLTLPKDENLRRIMLRRAAGVIDEAEFEDRHFAEEYAHFTRADGNDLGIPFDVSDRPEILAARMLTVLGFAEPH